MPDSGLRAIIFDLDGTLYRQGPLRTAMLARLARAYVTRPLAGVKAYRALGAYRAAQEQLRHTPQPTSGDLADAQIRAACAATGLEPAFVSSCVARWMEQAPLDLVARNVYPGVGEFLGACKLRGLRLGLFSDYPADAKLEALGFQRYFDAVLTAQSSAVGAFKPNPRGLLLVAEQLGVRPAECLYVGDRVEVDAAAAAAAGMLCALIGKHTAVEHTSSTWTFAGYAELRADVLGEGIVGRNQSSTSTVRPFVAD
jgi:HAD superfamily hydrolase (TIGR01509 family)